MSKTTALTTADDTAPAKVNIKTGGAIAALVPATLDDAFRLARALSASGDMVPKHFQGRPEVTMAAIIRGMEVGLAPMQALSHIAVINGRASIWGDAIPALIQRAGHTIDVEYEGDGDKLVAVATLTRGDTGKKIVRRFGMADAKRAGLAGKQGPWTQYPQRMCAHRARTWVARDGAADALMGLQIAEEVSDYGPDHARDVTPAAPRKGGVVYAAPEERDEIVEHLEADEDSDLFGVIHGNPGEQNALEALLSTIRRDLEGGADRAACEQFHADAIAAIGDDATEELDALFAEFEG